MMVSDPRDMLEILPSWEELKEEYEGKELMVIHYGHNHPTIETTIGILHDISERGIEIRDGVEAVPNGSYFLQVGGRIGWHSGWYPWDGMAKILSIVDLINKKIVFTRAWDKFMVDDAFENFYGKPWAVVKQRWIDGVEQMKKDYKAKLDAEIQEVRDR